MLKRITESNIRQYYIEIKKTVLKLDFRAVFNFVINETVYPINTLRNIAIRGVQTSHFFLSDMDFWPSSILCSC